MHNTPVPATTFLALPPVNPIAHAMATWPARGTPSRRHHARALPRRPPCAQRRWPSHTNPDTPPPRHRNIHRRARRTGPTHLTAPPAGGLTTQSPRDSETSPRTSAPFSGTRGGSAHNALSARPRRLPLPNFSPQTTPESIRDASNAIFDAKRRASALPPAARASPRERRSTPPA